MTDFGAFNEYARTMWEPRADRYASASPRANIGGPVGIALPVAARLASATAPTH